MHVLQHCLLIGCKLSREDICNNILLQQLNKMRGVSFEDEYECVCFLELININRRFSFSNVSFLRMLSEMLHTPVKNTQGHVCHVNSYRQMS